MAIELRDATSADAEGLVALKRRLFAETSFMLYAPDEYTATPDTAAKSISRVEKSGNSRLLLAFDDAKMIAFLGAYGSDVPRRRHTAQIVLGVVRAYWGRGIGASLLREAIRWAHTASILRLELGVMTVAICTPTAPRRRTGRRSRAECRRTGPAG